MNVNSAVNMILRMVMRRVIGKGVNAGIDMATRKMSGSAQPGAAPNDASPRDAGARRQSDQGKEVARRAQQMAKLGRRLGRF